MKGDNQALKVLALTFYFLIYGEPRVDPGTRWAPKILGIFSKPAQSNVINIFTEKILVSR